MKVSKAYLVGSYHKKRGEKCEDFVDGGTLNNITYAFLSDGSGSKTYGYETARCLKDAAKSFIYKLSGDAAFPPSDAFLLSYLNNALKACNYPEHDMGATFLMVAIKDNHFYTCHVGDGVIIGKIGQSFEVLSYPEHGMYANETYFLPSERDLTHFRSLYGQCACEFCFILASDGISENLYDMRTGNVMHACDTMYKWSKKYSERECSDILLDNLEAVFDHLGFDDKSIAIISQ